MLSGLSLERYENSNRACCQYAPELETALSQGKDPGVQSETGEAEKYCHKASSSTCIQMVVKAYDNKWFSLAEFNSTWLMSWGWCVFLLALDDELCLC